MSASSFGAFEKTGREYSVIVTARQWLANAHALNRSIKAKAKDASGTAKNGRHSSVFPRNPLLGYG